MNSVVAPEAPLNSRHRWIFAGSVLVATLLALALYVAMNPGGMTTDTFFQLEQAQRHIPYNDWHPVAMTWTWQWMMDLTGSIASMLFMQVVAAWGCAVLTSYYLLKTSRRGWSAFAGLFVLFMPNTVNIIGIVWKDTHLGLAMYFAVLMTLLVRVVPRFRWLMATCAMGALIYAGLVRKNSLVAVIPVIVVLALWMSVHALKKGKCWDSLAVMARIRRLMLNAGVVLVAFFVILGSVSVALDATTKPTKNSQFAQVMLDDLIFAVPQSAIDATDAPQDEKDRLQKAKSVCKEKGSTSNKSKSAPIWDSYWACYGRGKNGPFTEVEDPQAVSSIWKQTIPKNLDSYASYRLKTATKFLFTSRLHFVPSNRDINKPQSPNAKAALGIYTLEFGVAVFPWLYLGGVALGLSLAGCAIAVRNKRQSFGAVAIFCSGVLYILTYFPTAPANDYRYVFWPWLATMLGWLVLWADWQRRRNRRIR